MSRPNSNSHKKKVVMVIVEGPSDKRLLEVSLSEFFEKKYGENTIVRFPMFERDDGYYGTDITSLYGSNPEKIEMLINKKILIPELEVNGLYPRHVSEIIHIIDTDGAFIDESQVVPLSEQDQQKNSVNLLYSEEHIYASDVAGIQERNRRKVANIQQLLDYCKTGFPIRKYYLTEGHGNKVSSKDSVAPYSLYFFSCNMDHFTSNEMNWKGSKTSLAESFLDAHGDGFDELREFVNKTDPTISTMSFSDSWEYIQKGCNSLCRHSNLGILLNSLSD